MFQQIHLKPTNFVEAVGSKQFDLAVLENSNLNNISSK